MGGEIDLENDHELLEAIENLVWESKDASDRLMSVLKDRGFFSLSYPLSPFILGIGLFINGFAEARKYEDRDQHHSVLLGAQAAFTHPLLQHIMAQQVASGVGPK